MATPVPKKSRSSVRMGHFNARAQAGMGQSSGSRGLMRAKAAGFMTSHSEGSTTRTA